MSENYSLLQVLGPTIVERDFGCMCAYCYKRLDLTHAAAVVLRFSYVDRRSTNFNTVFYPDAPSLDHVVPKSRGGPTVLENLVLSCKSCNSRKHARLLGDRQHAKV